MKPLPFALCLTLALGAGCGGVPPMKPLETMPPSTPEPDPTTTHPLAQAMPADVLAFATMPGTQELSDVVAQVVEGADLLDLVGDEVADATSVSGAAVTGFLRDLDGVALGLTSERDVIVAMHTSDDDAVERLLADEAGFRPAGERDGVQRFTIASDADKLAELELHWHRERQLLLLGVDSALADSARALSEGASLAKAPSFTEAAKRFAPHPAVNAYVDLPRLAKLSALELPVAIVSPLLVSLTLGERIALRAAATIDGDSLPAPAAYVPPPKFQLPGSLPGDTVAFLAYSTRVGGSPERKSDMLLDALRSVDPDAARGLAIGAKAFGIDLRRALGALGDEGAIGFTSPPAAKHGEADLFWEGALLVARQQLSDPEAFTAVLASARDALATSKRASIEPLKDGFFARSTEEDAGAAIALRGDQLVIVVGHERGARALVDAKGATLADDSLYRRLAPPFAGEHVGLWLDLERGLDALSRNMPAEADELLSLARTSGERPIGGLSLGWQPEQDGWRVHATLHDVPTLGVVSALMIYSVRRYLAASKAAEAKVTVAAIARGARAAFERRGPGAQSQRLCESAEPVPSRVPSGQKYMPSRHPGEDFRSGNAERGWTCLHFGLTQPHYYRYTYQQGGGYLGPARGGPDPGPNGFEVAAEGDLDGDGDTSLFTMTGRVDPQTGELVVAPELFIDAELE